MGAPQAYTWHWHGVTYTAAPVVPEGKARNPRTIRRGYFPQNRGWFSPTAGVSGDRELVRFRQGRPQGGAGGREPVVEGVAAYGAARAAFDASAASPLERDALRYYTLAGSARINGFLRDGVDWPGVRGRIDLLDAVIERAPLPARTRLFRGLGNEMKLPPESQVGQILVDDGYMSASARRDIAEGFAADGGMIIELVVPAGYPALPASQFFPSDDPDLQDFEQELLLPRGTRIRVEADDRRLLPNRQISVRWLVVEVMGDD